MTTLAVLAALWGTAAALWLLARRRSAPMAREAARSGFAEFLRLVPRLAVGIVGAGFLAALMPREAVANALGPASGWLGVGLAGLAGALTPGGPVVGFALAAAAMEAGAGAPQLVAYATAWALFAVQRMLIWEVPSLPRRLVALRVAVSLPLPFLAALVAMLSGKP